MSLTGTLLLFVATSMAPAGADPARALSGSALQVVPETLSFVPEASDSTPLFAEPESDLSEESYEWMRTPIGEGLLTDRDQWGARRGRYRQLDVRGDYNRVDRIRLGLGSQLQVPDPMAPRLGGRIEYATGRNRVLYGFQLDQPLIPPGRISVGASLVRRTDHSELQQVSDAENSLALLLWRQDYRDYYEREGLGMYLAWHVPDFSTVSVHLRRDEYRSLAFDPGVRSLFHRSRTLRGNPPVNEGETHTVSLRLEHSARTSRHTHAGFYHWAEAEWAGRGLAGDFTYTRLLADMRSVVRLSPATTLMLRLAAGSTPSGTLPVQKEFPLGGVDGLRAHAFSQYRGDQLALAQAEYTVGLWRLRSGAFEGGLHAIVFLDAGRAWSDPRHRWALNEQHIAVDGGVGLAAAEDKLRIYFAKDLQRSGSDFVTSVRLHRPF